MDTDRSICKYRRDVQAQVDIHISVAHIRVHMAHLDRWSMSVHKVNYTLWRVHYQSIGQQSQLQFSIR